MLLPAPHARAQKITAGVIGGGSLTGGFPDVIRQSSPAALPIRTWSPSKDLLGGGLVEIALAPRWSLEMNAIFRQLNGNIATVFADGSLHSISPNPVVTWQFPVLVKHRWPGGRIRPFVVAGPSFRTTGNLNANDPSHFGVTAGAGLEIRARMLRISPAVRYTRWGRDKLYAAPTQLNQLELVAGFGRASESGWRPLGSRVALGFTFGTTLTRDFPARSMPAGPAPEIYPPAQWPVEIRTFSPLTHVYGASVKVDLWRRLALLAEALNRPVSTFAAEVTYPGGTRMRAGGHRPGNWSFPVLVRYRFPGRGAEPFLAFGPAFRMRQAYRGVSPFGWTAAAGVAWRAGRVEIAPGIRFTRWAPPRLAWDERSRRSQAELLVGFFF
jgi:hypothetical protein